MLPLLLMCIRLLLGWLRRLLLLRLLLPLLPWPGLLRWRALLRMCWQRLRWCEHDWRRRW